MFFDDLLFILMQYAILSMLSLYRIVYVSTMVKFYDSLPSDMD
ncbi:hypothetical protein OkiPb00232_54100 [Escherichia coli]|nr:hypothetical protein ECSTEC7V_5150 [Escherichia coli STEC_7v]EGE64930.1 hypothetical protein ECSTEC7V_1883 [Escherichia coli STEC_7v]EGE65005.1 hypothetical protein ECSTEC7V_1858 [Escherichia coli STEC_7v]EIG78915.1 hypothetical protein EC12741_0892 [Escherichia coli 1.2741]